MVETTGNRMMPMRTTDKPFSITKKQVYEAYKAVKSNHGAAGVDKETIEQFDANLQGNLYKLWNRMSSGSYFPPPVRAVPIPKKSGGERILGVPTVADRVAQMVVNSSSLIWIQSFRQIRLAIDPVNRPSMPSASRVSAAGNTTGF
jgi:RNA-directed DNA polymerase